MTNVPAPNTGWFGQYGHVLHTLRVIGADHDAEGKAAVRGTISNLLGMTSDNTDCVVGPSAQYRAHRRGTTHTGDFAIDCANCQWNGLAGALNGTSYGLHNVTVIG